MSAFAIPLPAGYRPDWVFKYHGRDPAGPTERVDGTRLTKAVDIGGRPVILDMSIGGQSVGVATVPALSAEETETARRIVARMLGLTGDPTGFEARAATEPAVARLIGDRAGLRFPLSATIFEGLVWAIVGQQVNLTFAATLRRTVIELAGMAAPDGMIVHPGPVAVAALDPEELGRRKFSRAKAAYLVGAATAIAEGRLDLEALPTLPAEEAAARFAGIKGIGPWTANYVLLRACGHPDVVPAGDAGLAAGLQAYFGLDRRPTPEEQRTLMAPFAPHRSYATGHFWAAWG